MIHSSKNIKIWDQVQSVLVLVADMPPKELKAFQKTINGYFEKGQKVSYLYYYNDKKLPEDIIRLGDTIYITKSDFNIFGLLKDKNLKEAVFQTKHDLLLCIYFKKIPIVNKIIKGKKANYKIGVDQEDLPNFDIAFMAESNNPEGLTQLVVKYLKQV